MAVKLLYDSIRGEFEAAMVEIYKPIAEAGTAAIDAAADRIKTEGRADIAKAGFSKRWQNTFRVDRYPKRGVSANAAALVYHRIPYADIFETGGEIRSKSGKMWVPLSNTPKKIGRNRMRPKVFRQTIGKLHSMQLGGKPFLGAKMTVSKRQAKLGKYGKPTLPKLRSGAAGQGIVRTVPLFVGVDSVRIRKRFNLRQIINRTADQLAELYLENLRVDD